MIDNGALIFRTPRSRGGNLEFMDCSGLRAVLLASNRIRAESQGHAALTRPSRIVRKISAILGVRAVITE